MFYKEIHSHDCLNHLSHHSKHTKQNIPYNLARRIILFISEEAKINKRLCELKKSLLSCSYPWAITAFSMLNCRYLRLRKKRYLFRFYQHTIAILIRKVFPLELIYYYVMWKITNTRGEWPSGLRRCSKNRKVPGSITTRHSAGPRDPTSLRGSRRPPGRKCKTQWLKSGEWGCPLDNGPKLAVGQPNNS